MSGSELDGGDALARAVRLGVVPVIEIDDPSRADALAETLLEAGLDVAEITFRTAAAADVIARLRERYPELLVGAGTVVRAGDVDRALDSGARFGLAPGLDRDTVAHALDRGFPYVPGVMTPSDLQLGVALGLTLFKFFPAVPAGGLALLRAIAAPFAALGLRFVPTGGVTEATLPDWLGEPAVAAVGGTWIANRRAIADGDWVGIGGAARAAVAAARAVRDRS